MNQLEIEPFLEPYFLANTPDYLVSSILASDHLKRILDKYSDDELLQTIRDADSTGRIASSELLKGYVALVAMLVRGDDSKLDLLRTWTPHRLRWLASIVAEWDRRRQPTSVASFNFATAVSPADATRSTTSVTSVQALHFGYRQ